MQYHYEKSSLYLSMYGTTYRCNHPVYNKCTLYKTGKRGLAVILQRYDSETKQTYWTEIDPWLNDASYLHERFRDFFDERSGEIQNGIYPTVAIRQIMCALKMKPIKRERWATCFNRRLI